MSGQTKQIKKSSKNTRYCSIGQASELLGVSIATLRRWEKAGKIKAERLDGKNRSFKVADLEKLSTAKPLSTAATAKQLRISESSVRRLQQKGELVGQRGDNGKYLFNQESIDTYKQLKASRKASKAASPSLSEMVQQEAEKRLEQAENFLEDENEGYISPAEIPHPFFGGILAAVATIALLITPWKTFNNVSSPQTTPVASNTRQAAAKPATPIDGANIIDRTITGAKLASETIDFGNLSKEVQKKLANNPITNTIYNQYSTNAYNTTNVYNTTYNTGGNTIIAGTGMSSSTSGTDQTLSVNYGSTAGTAAEGNKAVICPSGTGNLTGGGNSVTVGAGGTCNSLGISNNPTFTGQVTAGSLSTDGQVTFSGLGTGLIRSSATGALSTNFVQNSDFDSTQIYSNITKLNNVTVGGQLTVSGLANGIVKSNAGVLSGGNTVTLGTDTTGSYIQNLGSLTGLTTTGNTGAGSTPAISVAYGSTANTSVQGNTTLICPSGTGNLSGTGNTITLGSGGTCNSLSMVNNPTFSGLMTSLGVNAGTIAATDYIETPTLNATSMYAVSAEMQQLSVLPVNDSTEAFAVRDSYTTPILSVDTLDTYYGNGRVNISGRSGLGILSTPDNTTGDSQNMIMASGNSDFNSGSVVIDTGYGANSSGSVYIGTGNASSVNIGSNFIPTTIGGQLTVSGLTNGIVKATAGVLSGGNKVALGTDTTGSYIQNLGTLTGLTTTGNTGAGSTPTISVAYGSTANTSVQGNTTLICPSGTGNLSGTGNTITLGSGGTCNSLSIANNPTFSGLLTASNTGATALSVSGAPTASATSSLIRIGSAIAGGNSTANTGGTYIGLNAPNTGAGSTADFLNFQSNGTSKLKVDISGNTTVAGTVVLNNSTSNTIQGVDSTGATTGAQVTLRAGKGGSTSGTGGVLNLYGGDTGQISTAANGGAVNIAGGGGFYGIGGAVTIGGGGGSLSNGGAVSIAGGAGNYGAVFNTSPTGGNTTISGGSATGATGAVTVTGGSLTLQGGASTGTATTSIGGSVAINGGAGVNTNGSITIGTSTTASTSIGNATGTLQLTSNAFNLSTAGAISGITGYTQGSGNFSQSGTGTFGTATGSVSLNGNTTIASGKTLSVGGNTSVSGNLSLTRTNGTGTNYITAGTWGVLQDRNLLADTGNAASYRTLLASNAYVSDQTTNTYSQLNNYGNKWALELGGAQTSLRYRAGASGSADTWTDTGWTDLMTVSNTSATFKNGTDSTTAFRIQNAVGTNVLSVDTSTDNSILSNSTFESGTTGWTAKVGATLTQVSSAVTAPYKGSYSLEVATTATANDGAYSSVTLTPSTVYTLSFYAKVTSGTISDFVVGRQDVSGTDVTCLTAQTLTTSWTRFSCSFTTGSTITNSNVFFQKSGSTAETFYLDQVLLQKGASSTTGNISLGGAISSAVNFQSTSSTTTAFQIQNAAGTTSLFNANTSAGVISLQNYASNETPTYGAELLGNNWTDNGNWNGANTNAATNTFQHIVTGGSSPYTQTLTNTWYPTSTSSYYQVNYTVTGRTLGSFTITTGGVTSTSVTASGSWAPRAVSILSTDNLVITPTADFDGTVVFSIKQITGTTNATLRILDSAGNAGLEVRTGGLQSQYNIFIGINSGIRNTVGISNTALGGLALAANTTGFRNTALGASSLTSNTAGFYNTGLGAYSLTSNTTGNYNTATGMQALQANTTGNYNTGYGTQAIYANTTGNYNIGIGHASVAASTTSSYNTGVGYASLNVATGSNNTAIGASGARSIITGTGNVFVGYSSGYDAVNQLTSATNSIAIGQNTYTTASNQIILGNTSISQTLLQGAPANTATTALLKLGAAMVGGNSATNGGTYFGVNTPSSGAGSAADLMNLQSAGTTKLKVDSTGTLTVTVASGSASYAICTVANGAGTKALEDCAAAPSADYAEQYPLASGIDYGDIVATGSKVVNTYADENGSVNWDKVKGQITELVKTSSGYQGNTVGIVSDNHGDFTSAGHNIKDEDNPMPVALNGRVPVNMAPDSEPVSAGDYLTTSGTYPGKATKATGSGYVIGKALAGWNPGQEQVMVFVEPGYNSGPSTLSYIQDGGSATLVNLTVSGNLEVKGLLKVADIEVNGHIITRGDTPQITAKDAAGTGASVSIEGNDTSGTITINSGSGANVGDLAEITFAKSFGSKPRVILSASNDKAAKLQFFKSASKTGFVLKAADGAGQTSDNTTYEIDYQIMQ